jgi:hypothetical protein
MPPTDKRSTEGRRLYECEHCKKLAPWDDSWAWYGSYKQHEDFGSKGVAPVKTMCSADCRVAMVAAFQIPDEGLDDRGNVIEDDEPQRRQRLR